MARRAKSPLHQSKIDRIVSRVRVADEPDDAPVRRRGRRRPELVAEGEIPPLPPPLPPPAPEPPPEDDREVVGPERGEVYEQVWAIQERLGSDAQHAVVRVQRRDKEGQFRTLRSMPLLNFSEDALIDRYGGGTYNLRFYRGAEYLGSTTIHVDESQRAKPDPNDPALQVGAAAVAAGASPAAAADPRMAFVEGQTMGLKMLVESQSTLVNGLLGALVSRAGNAAPAADPLDVGLKIASAITSAQQGHGGPSARELVSDMAETFREGLKFGQLVNAPEQDSFKGVLDAFASPVAKAIEAQVDIERRKVLGPGAAPSPAPSPVVTGTVPNGGPAPAPNNPSSVPPVPGASGPPASPMFGDFARAPWLVHLRAFLPEALHWARNGWDAESYVVSLVARIPDHILDEMAGGIQALGEDYVPVVLAALGPPFQPFRTWASAVLVALKEELEPEPEEEIEPGEPGDGGDGAALAG